MIAVIDTNVLVSGVINPNGAPGAVLRLIATGKLTVVFDNRILHEYRAVLKRSRFGFKEQQIEELLDLIEKDGISVIPVPLAASVPDPGDLPFMEVAAACGSCILVTRNKKHYPPKLIPTVKILSPAELIEAG